jgi:mono/diheme cytochrome c family protein
MLQTMYYHGYDNQPDIGAPGAPFNGAMFEITKNLTRSDYLLARYDIASSDELNRQYILDYAHNFVPNLKATVELGMSPGNHPSFGLALDWAGPWQFGTRFNNDLQTVALNENATPPPIAHFSNDDVAAETPAPAPAASSARSADTNNGAKLVQANGCEGCHGAGLKGGGIGPALYGIERKLTLDQIASFIQHPKPPMPNFGFSDQQTHDIAAYLSSLDGGANSTAPIVTFDPASPTDIATIMVRFPGTPPKDVSVLPVMQMGASTMQTRLVHLTQSSTDPHVFTGRVVFSMGGPWTVKVQYDGTTMDVPLTVGS